MSVRSSSQPIWLLVALAQDVDPCQQTATFWSVERTPLVVVMVCTSMLPLDPLPGTTVGGDVNDAYWYCAAALPFQLDMSASQTP